MEFRTATVGTKVRATTRITEGGDGFDGKEDARLPDYNYIHAEKGDTGEIVEIDSETLFPTVRFERTGTATIVFQEEVELRA